MIIFFSFQFDETSAPYTVGFLSKNVISMQIVKRKRFEKLETTIIIPSLSFAQVAHELILQNTNNCCTR